MENATKALLIAAGVLFAVVIVSVVWIAYGNISGYYGAKQNNLSQEQLAAFNNEYATYDRDLTGFELVSLINKAIDFNEHKIDEGYTQMSVTAEISNSSSYNRGGLFDGLNGKAVVYDGKNSNGNRTALKNIIKSMQDLEKKYTAGVLTKLVSNLESFKSDIKGQDGRPYNPNGNDDNGKTIKDVLGKEYNNLPTREELLKYSDYLVFKRGNFKSNGAQYENGQIVSFSFTQQ